MNGDLIEYERLRKLCSEYNLFLKVELYGINVNGVGVRDLNELGIYLLGFIDGSKTKEQNICS